MNNTVHLCITYRQMLMAICDAIANKNQIKTTIVILLDYQFIPFDIRYRLVKSFVNIHFCFVYEHRVLESYAVLPKFFPSIMRRNITIKKGCYICLPQNWTPSFFAGCHFATGYIYHSGPFMAKVLRGLCERLILREDGLSNYVVQRVSLGKGIIRFCFGLSPTAQVWGEEPWVHAVEAEHPDRLPDQVKGKAQELKFSQLLTAIDPLARIAFMKVFGLESFAQLETGKSCVLLTQPVSEVGLCSTELKMTLYRQLVAGFIAKGYTVYVKRHPKEGEYLLEHTIRLPSAFPIELWYYITGHRFDCGVALCSSALASDAEPIAHRLLQLIPLEYFNARYSSKWMAMMNSHDIA